MQYIEFNVQHQVITRTDEFEVVANSQNYLSARFTFSEEWAELQQTAVFSTNGGAAISVLIEDGECVVPWEVLRGREFWVGVFAGDRITSNLVRVPVDMSVRLNASPGVQPTPSAYELLVGRVEEALRKGPKIGDNENWWVWDATVGEFVDTGVYSHGNSPYVGSNGNWWVGNDDTGVYATGPKGDKGDKGDQGMKGDQGDKGDPGNNIQSIVRTAGTGAPGTTDTYTVTLTDGSTTNFNVYNGADGLGAGDMTAVVYDPQGKKTDIFAYAARSEEHYVKSYASLVRLGITEGTETIEGIAASLPNNATLQYPVSPANNLSILPSGEDQYGTMLVNRVDSARVSFTYIRKGVRHGAYSGVYGTDQGWSGWSAPVTAKPLGIYGAETTVAEQVQYWFDQHIRWGIFQAALCPDLPAEIINWDNGIEFKVLSGYRVEITATALNNMTFKRHYDALSKTYTTEWEVTPKANDYLRRDGSNTMNGVLYMDDVSGQTMQRGYILEWMGNFHLRNYYDDNNFTDIVMKPGDITPTVVQVKDGVMSEYGIYHAGNLPVEAATAELID